MQLGEIIYGITKFLPTLADSIPSYSYECTIYNYEHRVLQISPLTQIFQFKFWYEVRMNYHPKNPNDLSYTSGYRFYIDWTRPEIFNSDNEPGIYNLMYEKWYTRTPMFQDWELRFANKDNETHSLVFANQEFA
jgi:hypothetical protein